MFIPLSAITSKACQDYLDNARAGRKGELVVSTGGTIEVKAKTFDASRDAALTTNEYGDAASNLCTAMRLFFIPLGKTTTGTKLARKITKMFKKMFADLQGRPDFNEQFPVYREYTRFMVQFYIDNPGKNICINVFQDNVFNNIKATQLEAKVASLDSLLAASAAQPAAKALASKSGHASSSRGKSQSQSTFRSNTGGAVTPVPPIRCSYCAGPHTSKNHEGDTGKYLTRGAKGFVDAQGNLYCMGFNGPNGCKSKTCRYKHLCSLCGAGNGKGAQHCSCC